MKALSPSELLDNLITTFPPEMVKAVNNQLMKKFHGRSCKIMQNDIINEFLSLTGDKYTKDKVYDNHWMDFEQLFIKEGWIVKYTKSDYTENWFEPYYSFSIKNNG